MKKLILIVLLVAVVAGFCQHGGSLDVDCGIPGAVTITSDNDIFNKGKYKEYDIEIVYSIVNPFNCYINELGDRYDPISHYTARFIMLDNTFDKLIKKRTKYELDANIFLSMGDSIKIVAIYTTVNKIEKTLVFGDKDKQ